MHKLVSFVTLVLALSFAQFSWAKSASDISQEIDQLLAMDVAEANALLQTEKANIAIVAKAIDSLEAALLNAKEIRKDYSTNHTIYQIATDLRVTALVLMVPTGLNALQIKSPAFNKVVQERLEAAGEEPSLPPKPGSLRAKYLRNCGKLFIASAIIAAVSHVVAENAFTETMQLNEKEIRELQTNIHAAKAKMQYQQDFINILEKRVALNAQK